MFISRDFYNESAKYPPVRVHDYDLDRFWLFMLYSSVYMRMYYTVDIGEVLKPLRYFFVFIFKNYMSWIKMKLDKDENEKTWRNIICFCCVTFLKYYVD